MESHPVMKKPNTKMKSKADLEAEAKANETEDMSPLHDAVKKNCMPLLMRLLNANVSLHSRDINGFSPMHLAVCLRRKRIVNLLLKASIGHNPMDAWGFSHVHAAAMLDWYDVVEECFKFGANLNQQIVEKRFSDSWMRVETMDQCRAKQRQHVWPLRLVRHWEDDNITTATNNNQISIDGYWPGYSALHFAIENRAFSTFKLLMQKRANPNVRTDAGVTPLHMACALPDNINREYVRWLLVANADINAVTVSGETPMHVAAHHGSLKALEVLIYCKTTFVNVHIVNNTGQTGLHVLVNTSPTHPDERYRIDVPEKIKVKMVEILLEAGCRTDALQNNKKTALQVALENKLMDVADVLRRAARLFASREETSEVPQETMSLDEIIAQLDQPLEGD